jgi:hypothetical protein
MIMTIRIDGARMPRGVRKMNQSNRGRQLSTGYSLGFVKRGCQISRSEVLRSSCLILGWRFQFPSNSSLAREMQG